jgi:hypothetical protein
LEQETAQEHQAQAVEGHLNILEARKRPITSESKEAEFEVLEANNLQLRKKRSQARNELETERQARVAAEMASK